MFKSCELTLKPIFTTNMLVARCIASYIVKQVDILISKNQVLQILYLKYHAYS